MMSVRVIKNIIKSVGCIHLGYKMCLSENEDINFHFVLGSLNFTYQVCRTSQMECIHC